MLRVMLIVVVVLSIRLDPQTFLTANVQSIRKYEYMNGFSVVVEHDDVSPRFCCTFIQHHVRYVTRALSQQLSARWYATWPTGPCTATASESGRRRRSTLCSAATSSTDSPRSTTLPTRFASLTAGPTLMNQVSNRADAWIMIWASQALGCSYRQILLVVFWRPQLVN